MVPPQDERTARPGGILTQVRFSKTTPRVVAVPWVHPYFFAMKALDATLAKPAAIPDRDVLRGKHIRQARLVLHHLNEPTDSDPQSTKAEVDSKGCTRGAEAFGKPTWAVEGIRDWLPTRFPRDLAIRPPSSIAAHGSPRRGRGPTEETTWIKGTRLEASADQREGVQSHAVLAGHIRSTTSGKSC